jgi:uncharacterized flavoprotein (TIGR03862 family)
MKQSIAIVGGGTASLFLASFLDKNKFDVTVYESNNSLGRKFLVAGDGGFNLTHSEPLIDMVERYVPISLLRKSLTEFSNLDLRTWLESIGIKTFVGSSGRVFPIKGIKPIEVLNAITDKLKEDGVSFKFNSKFIGWSKSNELIFTGATSETENIKSDINVFALGGASWKVTGSDGGWLKPFSKKGITTVLFCPSNCSYDVEWPETFIQKNEGEALKNITISCDGATQKGEVVVTEFGIEGNAIYGLSSQIQKQLSNGRDAKIEIDFKKNLDEVSVFNKLKNSNLNTTKTLKNTLKLSAVQMDMLRFMITKEEFVNHKRLAQKIKNFPLVIKSAGPIDEAISTTGGVAVKALTKTFELKELPNNYCIGEMVDWNSPTGGYLIQGCASMGVFLARTLNNS